MTCTRFSLTALALMTIGTAHAGGFMETQCSIRSSGTHLDCQVLGKDRHVLRPDDITKFLASDETYIKVMSRKGALREFKIDKTAPQFARLKDIEANAPISVISNARLELYHEIEKRAIETSATLDTKMDKAELILTDSSIVYGPDLAANRALAAELKAAHSKKNSSCASTPEFKKVANQHAKLERALSNIIMAFGQPESCMGDFKVFKDQDGRVDLRQLNDAPKLFKSNCHKN